METAKEKERRGTKWEEDMKNRRKKYIVKIIDINKQYKMTTIGTTYILDEHSFTIYHGEAIS